MPHAMQQQPAMHQPMMGNQGFSLPAFGQPVLGFGQGGALGHGDSFGNQYTPAFCPIGNQYTPAFGPAGLLPCELITRYCARMQQSQRFFGGPGIRGPEVTSRTQWDPLAHRASGPEVTSRTQWDRK